MPGGSGGNVHALFVSADRRIPKIRIQTRQLANLIDKRIIASVDSWEPNSRYPSGHYVRTIGDIGDRATESDVSPFLPLLGLGSHLLQSSAQALVDTCYVDTWEGLG